MMKKKLAFVMAMALSAGLVLPGCTSGTGTTSSTGSTTSGDASSAGSTSSSGTQMSTVTGGKEGGTSLTFTTGGDQGTYYGFVVCSGSEGGRGNQHGKLLLSPLVALRQTLKLWTIRISILALCRLM